MATPVYGENCVLSILVSGTYYPILCGTDMSYTRTPEFIEKTGPTSGFSREYVVRIEDWMASVSGLTMIENDSNVTFFTFFRRPLEEQYRILSYILRIRMAIIKRSQDKL